MSVKLQTFLHQQIFTPTNQMFQTAQNCIKSYLVSKASFSSKIIYLSTLCQGQFVILLCLVNRHERRELTVFALHDFQSEEISIQLHTTQWAIGLVNHLLHNWLWLSVGSHSLRFKYAHQLQLKGNNK